MLILVVVVSVLFLDVIILNVWLGHHDKEIERLRERSLKGYATKADLSDLADRLDDIEDAKVGCRDFNYDVAKSLRDTLSQVLDDCDCDPS